MSQKSIECPFTWEFDVKLFQEKEWSFTNLDQSYFSLFFYSISTTYVHVLRENYDISKKEIKKIEEAWEKIDQEQLTKENISVKVLIHIKEATKYCALMKINEKEEAEKLIKSIEDFNNFQCSLDRGTLYGCKSIIQSYFDDKKNNKVLLLIRLAISQSPNCPMWHFNLGKNLRKCRRRQNYSKPSKGEKEAFLKSYELSKDPYFGIYVAQMYRENEEYNKSDEIYLEIYDMMPSNHNIRLKLALGFIRKKDFEKAQNCLYYVEQFIPNDMNFLHYKGIYYQKTKQFEEAIEYFRRAANYKNFGADLQYANCMLLINKNDLTFDYVNHLKMMLQKYGDDNFYKQSILLNLTMHYYHKKKDILNAAKYVLESIIVDSENMLLKRFYTYNRYYNIYDFVDKQLIPKCRQNFSASREMQEILEKLEILCNQYKFKKY